VLKINIIAAEGGDAFFGVEWCGFWPSRTRQATNRIYAIMGNLGICAAFPLSASKLFSNLFPPGLQKKSLQTHQNCRSLLTVSTLQLCAGLEQEPKLTRGLPTGRRRQSQVGGIQRWGGMIHTWWALRETGRRRMGDNLKRGPRLQVGGEQRMGGRAREIKTIHMFRVELEPESCFGLTASGRKGDSPQVHTSNA